MLSELMIHHVEKGNKRYLFLTKDRYRLGKALDNDIVLLDANCPSYLGVIEKNEHGYHWLENQTLADLNLPHASGGFVFQVKNKKKWISVTVFSALFVLSLFFFQWAYNDESVGDEAHKLPARGTYGHLNSEDPDPVAQVEFEFDPPASKYLTLHYTSGNLSKGNELQININGHFLGFAPASPGKWNVESKKFIPQSLLVEKNNKVSFVFAGSKSQSWGVRDIYMETSESMPLQQDGKDFLITAKKLLKERSVKRGNLVRAQQILDQGMQFYQASNQEPPEVLSKLVTQVQKEKYRLILEHGDLVRKYLRENDRKKAKDVYASLMDELIDPMDSDRQAVEKEFE
jgi:hypothetical protein